MNLDEIKKIYFCPGARNHDLLKHLPEDRVLFEIDERSASFKALGHAMGKNEISAVCTTSGTAVAECLPAMIEAYYSNQRLLLLSADRPSRMRDTGAPQTINHELVTRGHRRFYKDINLEELKDIPFNNIEYPAHINVIIENKDEFQSRHKVEHTQSWDDFGKFTSANHSPLILISHGSSELRALAEIFKVDNLPFYAEILSNAHELSYFQHEYELIHRLNRGDFDSIIRIGHTPLAKLWRLMEKMHLPIFNFDSRGMSALSYGKTMQIDVPDLIKSRSFWELISHYSRLKFKDIQLPRIETLLKQYPESEPATLDRLLSKIPEGSLVYLGNSLTIRLIELIHQKRLNFYGNRGANGIDGQISTAIGLASSTRKKVYCIVGDLTAMYDIGAFSQIPDNLHIVIMNNKGGKIFETMQLSIRMCMNHDKNFERIISAFNQNYSNDNLATEISSGILELFPNHEQTLQFLKELK